MRPAPARRVGGSRWRQPRLLAGVALVLTSALLGGWLLTTARDATDYWVVADDVRAGQRIDAGDLAVVAGRVEAPAAGALVEAADGMPAGVWSRDLATGALVTKDAIAESADHGRQLPLALETGALPADLAAGHVVDVWSSPGAEGDAERSTRRILTAVPVVAVSRPDGTGSRTVVVDTGGAGPVASVVAASTASRLTVVRVP